MAKKEKKSVIELPVKIMLTSEGVQWFITNKRQIRRLRMADNRLEYGISLPSFSAASLQKMINIDYIAAVEIARTEFSDKRREVIDLTKLIVYRILYRAFERETYRLLLASPLIKRWNRAHPSRIIDDSSLFNPAQMEGLLKSCAPELPEVSQDIQSALLAEIDADPALSAEDREIQRFLCERYVISMRNITWCLLARSRTQPEYRELIGQVSTLLRGYLARARIAEYLSLMVTELLTYAESIHTLETARRIYPGASMTAEALRSPRVREAVTAAMAAEQDYLYLSYQVTSKVPSIGTENRLKIVVFNRAREYQVLKERIENKIGIDIKERSLVEFYRRLPAEEMGTELGLYYLSFLSGECAKCDVHLESRVSEIPASDLMLITLSLQF
jgi:hypothetical protein